MKKIFLILPTLLMLGACAAGTTSSPGPSGSEWTYQEGDRRLHFKNVVLTSRNGLQFIEGSVENVGNVSWSNPTVNFLLLNSQQQVVGTASTRRRRRLGIGEVWRFQVQPNPFTSFELARFNEPTGW